MNAQVFRSSLTDAIRFWERGRVLYNIALAAVVGAVFLFNLPLARDILSFDLFQSLFVLAVLANVAYCAAYPVDLLVQASGYRATWLQVRWVLLVIGILFASVITQFFARAFLGAAT